MTQPVDEVSVAIVPDFDRFPAEMRAGVDRAMRELAARVDAAMQGVEQDFREAGSTLGRDMQVGGEVAEHAFRELSHTATVEMAEVEAKTTASASLFAAKFQAAGALASSALLGIGAAAAAGLGALTFMGLKAAATMEQTQIQFKGLLGSAETAEKVLKDLLAFAAQTPFEFADITPIAARFFNLAQILGMAKTDVTQFLTVLGDLASATGGGTFAMERVAFAMGQIASKGRLAAQDINQIGDALVGFPVRERLAAELGLSVADAMQQMENGSIDAQTGLRALMRAMATYPGAAGMMVAQSQTLIGLFSTFKDTINLALIKAFQPAIPAVKAALGPLTDTIGKALAQLAPPLSKALIALLPLIGQFVNALVPVLVPGVEAFSTALEQMKKTNVLQDLGQALGQVMEAIGPNMDLFVEFAIVMLQLAVPALKVLAALLNLTAPTVEIFAASLHELNRALSAIDWAGWGHAIAGFFTGIWNSITILFSGIGETMGKIPAAAEQAFDAMRMAAATRITELIKLVTGLPARLLNSLATLKDLLVDSGANMIRGLWHGISGMAGWLAGRVKAFVIDNTLGAIKDALGIHSESKVMAREVGRWIPAGIGMGVQQGAPSLRGLLAGMAASLPGAAAPAAAGAGAGTMTFGPGSIVVQFHGDRPTAQQAYDTGLKVSEGVAAGLQRRGVATATRQRT